MFPNKRVHPITFISAVIISTLLLVVLVEAATTISTNISTGGTLTVTGTSELTGDVGIATSTPNQPFTIFKSTGDSAIELSSLTGDPYKWTIGQDYSDGGKFKIASSTALGTNDRFVIDGSGNVGVATSSPSVPLEVLGDVRFGEGNLFNGFFFDATAGKLGIGTAAPTEQLTVGAPETKTFSSADTAVYGAGGAYSIWRDVTNDVEALVGSETGKVIFGSATNHLIQFRISNNEKVVIDTSGNLGIGTSTPNNLLQVAGVTGPQLLLTDTSGGTDLKHFYASSTAGALAMGEFNDDLSTYTERMRIDASGNVGIGTTTPANIFHVSSGASATTTISIGELDLTSSKACVNMNQVDGSAGSFYIAGNAIVVEANYCN